MRKTYWTILALVALGVMLLICIPALKLATAQQHQRPITKSLETEPQTSKQQLPSTDGKNSRDPNRHAEETNKEPQKEPENEPQKKPEPESQKDSDMQDQPDIDITAPVVSTEMKKLLATYVDKNGLVNYQKLRRLRGELRPIEKQLNNVHPAKYISWSKNERIAFWINNYNIFTLKLIIDNYPIDPIIKWPIYPKNSIMQIRGPWTKHYFKVMGLEYTLREIEKDMLMDKFGDPRICFALSLANIAGPPLLNEPYLPEKIDEQLDEQIKKYFSSPQGLKIDHTAKTVHMSVIFKLNEKRFINKYEQIKKFRNKKPNIRAFLNFVVNYIDPGDAKRIQDGDYKVEFIRYNWTLNEQPKQTKK